MVGIIDYGMGNIHSVQKALQSLGADTLVTNKADDIEKCRKLILPGVGAFDDAITELKKQKLIPAIKKHLKYKKPFLGICLGMQLLFETSQEAERENGLGIIKGKVVRFLKKLNVKVPHIGWNQLNKLPAQCPLLKDIPANAHVYFCHSYYVVPKQEKIIAATTSYGLDFASVICKDNIYGVQFHPEKSQEVGLGILKNFVAII